jgi:hypothetical protein
MVSGIVLPLQRIVNGRFEVTGTVGPAESTVLEVWTVTTHEDRKDAECAVKKQDYCLRGSTCQTQDRCLIFLGYDTLHPTLRKTSSVTGGVVHLDTTLLKAL